MASPLLCIHRRSLLATKTSFIPRVSRSLTTQAAASSPLQDSPSQDSPTLSLSPSPSSPSDPEPNTHYRITLRRSAISLASNVKGTLVALGLHRRMQTVFHRHTPESAGKILRVKELVEVANVPASAVRTKTEQMRARKSPRGFVVVGSKLNKGANLA